MASGPPPSASRVTAPLRIVFMGTPGFAAHILEHLHRACGPAFEVVAVVTRPDRPRGRGMKAEPSEVGALAASYALQTLKPDKIRTQQFADQLKALSPDSLVVAAYGRILPRAVLELPRLGPLNVHASLLPRHRGPSPIEAAILAGDTVTGVTIMRMTEQMDAGPILLQASASVAPGETLATLRIKLAELGARTLLDALTKLRAGELIETPQNESQATYTTLIKKTDALIAWSAAAIQIERMTRAYDPWPVAYTKLDGNELRIYRASVEAAVDPDVPPGTVIRLDPTPTVKCGTGALRLTEVQAAGRKRMAAQDFARGRRLKIGQRLGQ